MKCMMGWRRKFQVLGLVMAGVVTGSVTSAMAIESKPSGEPCREKPVCKPPTQSAEEIPAPPTAAPPAAPAPEVTPEVTPEVAPESEPEVSPESEAPVAPAASATPAASSASNASAASQSNGSVVVQQETQAGSSVQVQVDLHLTQNFSDRVAEIAVLEALTIPVRGRVVKCETELEEARRVFNQAAQEAARCREVAARRLQVIVQLRDLFASEHCEITWKGETFSRESVGEALRHQISLYRLEREESSQRDQVEATRRAQLEAVEARVLKWRREEEELVRMVEVLRAEAAAAEAAGGAAAVPATTRDEAAALSTRIQDMLGTVVPPLEDSDRRLLDEADSLIQGTIVGVAPTTPEGSE